MDTDSTVPAAESVRHGEHSFRRGFMHGYAAALGDLDAGKSKQQMADHLDNAIREWREGDCNSYHAPPVLG